MEKRKLGPLISVIIHTHNPQKTVRQCLQSIPTQTYKRIETIVMDRYNMDETTQRARQLKSRVFVTRERSTAKNLGTRKANRGYCLTRFARYIKRLLEQPIYLDGLVTLKLIEHIACLTSNFTGALGRTPLIRDGK